MAVALRDIFVAHYRLRSVIRTTPMELAVELGAEIIGPVYLKLENLQKTGSFKIRGAVNKIASLTLEEKSRGVITASSGNHAQGVGYAAQAAGIRAKVFVPESTPRTKLAAIRRYGVEVVVAGRDYDTAEAIARQAATAEGLTFIHAYGDPMVIAGQGTVGLEMLLEQPDLEVIVVPMGGGGLIAGIAMTAKTINSNIRVYGVQSVASPPWYYAFRAGHSVPVEYKATLADGLAGGIEGGPFDLVQKYVDDVVLVEEADIAAAVKWFATQHHLVVEGSGAVGVAALQTGRIPSDGVTGVVVSGGNIDSEKLAEIISR